MGCASSTPAVQETEKVADVAHKSSNGQQDSGRDKLDHNAKTAKAVGAVQIEVPLTKSTSFAPTVSSITSPSFKDVNGRIGDERSINPRAKERRAAAGSEAVRDQIRKLVVGGPQTKEEKANVYEVSDSEDEETQAGDFDGTVTYAKGSDVVQALFEALKKTFIFKGIPDNLLLQVIDHMYEDTKKGGSVVLQQGDVPKPDDCMYVLYSGEAEVVISGAIDQRSRNNDEIREVDGNMTRIPQKPGWVFGDVTLLFHSPRTASVVAKTDIVLWSLDRSTFLKFVMKYAQGARALRFLRKLPLLKGLSDNDLLRAAARMPQRVYKDGQYLIRCGEAGDEMYLIRYGKVRVYRPDGNGGRIEVAVLGRGQFVGERAVINDRLRSADCIAWNEVEVVVMKKRDFLDLDNPLLSWMLDYDAVATVMKSLEAFKAIKQEQMEHILDRFDARDEFIKDDTIISQGDKIEKLYVIKLGDIKLFKEGQPVVDPDFIKEVAGFSFFGHKCIESIQPSPYTLKVASETLHMLSLPRKQLDQFFGSLAGNKAASVASMVAALKKHKQLQKVNDAEISNLIANSETVAYNAGEVIALANGTINNTVYIVKSGEVAVVSTNMMLPNKGTVELQRITACEKALLPPGGMFNEAALFNPDAQQLEASLVATAATTVVIQINALDLENLANAGRPKTRDPSRPRLNQVRFADLEMHRIVGTGQFGMVRVVRNVKTNEVYALKAMHKAPIVESKQIEHVVNERRLLEEASHPFTVRLCGAYQDKGSLYLLQEWVPGGEMFHHLDLEGAFDEPTAMFYAANVLLALEFLHSKGIVYRDLKPENLLIDTSGYLKVADFGFAKQIGNDKTFTICGTPDYQAPEVIMRRGTTKAADYWALGVLIFEMLVGDPPFKSLTGDPWDTFRRTLSGRFYVPNFISDGAADLIFKLLQVNPEKRLGSGPTGADEIKRHRWFSRLDMKLLEQKKLPAPMKPKVRNPLDTSNFDNFDNVDVEPPPIPAGRADKLGQNELWEWIDGTGP